MSAVKRSISIILCLIFCLALFPASALAESGGDLYWSLDNGVLTISGTGEMPDFGKGATPPWYAQRGSIRELRIESGVTGLGKNAFDGCTKLSDIWYYGDAAQWERMESGFARENSSLLNVAVHIPPPDGNSDKCGDGLSWSLKNGVLTVSGKGRMYDYQIEAVRPPWSRQRGDIVRVEIGSGVTHVGDCAFDYIAVGPNDISSLQSVVIPKTVTSIGWNAFGRCCELTDVTLPGSVTVIGNAAFKECSALTGSLSIPKGTVRVYPYAFQYCDGLTDITIPKGVTTIGDYAFSCCRALRSVTIPESVTEIGANAFEYCDSLTDVYYGGSARQWAALKVGGAFANATVHTS